MRHAFTCRVIGRVAVGLILAAGVARSAEAELVYLTSGRIVSVERVDEVGNGRVRLTLRQGGQIVCARALIARVVADELPALPTRLASAPGVARSGLAGIIAAASARHGVDPALVWAIIAVESAFAPDARSLKGAMGLMQMQLMPATAAQYAVDDPFDPAQNIEAGTRHLRSLLDRFDMTMALAAYNAGVGAVARFGGIPPYRETREYVARVLRLLH